MSLHHSSDESKRGRECPTCRPAGKPNPYIYGSSGCVEVSDCTECQGTGRIEGEPDIEVSEFTIEGRSIGWFWQSPPSEGPLSGNPSGDNEVQAFPTEADALTAAQAALKGEKS